MKGERIKPGMVMHKWICAWRLITGCWTTYWTKGYMRLWGVRLGDGCRFFGTPILRKYPGSTIVIGQQCTFISSTHYNFIGVNHPCVISTHNSTARLTIGEKCGFSGTAIGCALDIRIGDRVRCGANTIITDTDWHTNDPRTSPDSPVILEDDVWLGVNVTVLKGVEIGEGSVIGAGSMVANSIPAGVVAAGVPAKVLRPVKNTVVR